MRTNSTTDYNEHPDTTSSPLDRTPCQQALSTSSHQLPTDHSPIRMPREPPPTDTSTPQPATDRKNSTACASNTHTTRRDAPTPVQNSTNPRPPLHQQCRPDTMHAAPPPPPRDQATDAPRGDPQQPPPPPPHQNTTVSPLSRGNQEKPHHQTSQATTTTTLPNPHHPRHHTTHHQPPQRASATPYITPKRYGGTSGGSETSATPPRLRPHPKHPGSHPDPGGHPG